MLTVVVRAVALVGAARIAVVGAARARRRLLIGRARLAGRQAAALRLVALVDRGTAVGRARSDDVRWALRARPGADLVGIAHVAGAGAADRARVAGRVLA